jgi:hypothetical protein
MKCPVCSIDLLISDRQGVEIDYCPKCRGIWLDRGELDKIIERSEQQVNTTPRSYNSENRKDDFKYSYDDKEKYYKHHKKKSILSELFDF